MPLHAVLQIIGRVSFAKDSPNRRRELRHGFLRSEAAEEEQKEKQKNRRTGEQKNRGTEGKTEGKQKENRMKEYVITNDNFDTEVLRSEQPVLLDFRATWCGPCKMLAPIIEELAKEYDGRLKVGMVDVDEEPELAVAFQVASIPTVVLIKDGKLVKEAIGYHTKEELIRLLEL